MQMKAKRTYEKPVLTRSRILLQSVVAQSGSPVPPDDTDNELEEDIDGQ